MKAIKRTVAGLLATLMFASCFSFNFAFGADNYTDDEAIAVSKVNAANIMTGTDNGFEPSKTLTRAEAAAIVVRMKGVPASQVEGAKGNTLFTDVPASSWAAGYINAASAMGIISGVGNGLFLPEREVSIVEFSAMAIRALGAGKLVDSIGTWPTNYVNFATEEKLFDGVLKAYTAPATRMDVAFMVVNTIEANMWEKTQVTNTSEVTYEKVKPAKTLLGDVLKITEYKSLKVNNVDTKEREVSFTGTGASEIANFDVVEGVELASLRSGHEVDVWAKLEDKEIVRIAPAEKSKLAKISFSKIEKINNDDNEITLIVNGKEKTYKYATTSVSASHDRSGAADAACTKCGAAASAACVAYETIDVKVSYNTLGSTDPVSEGHTRSGANTVACTICKADANDPCNTIGALENAQVVLTSGAFFGTAELDGNEITTIYAERYEERAVVKEVKNDNIYFESKTNKVYSSDYASNKLDMSDEDIEYVVTKDGKEIDVTDIEKGDALYFYRDDERIVICVNNKSVTGTAKQVSAAKYVKVDGTKYELAIPSVSIEAGAEVKLYLNAANKVTMYEIIDGAVDSTVAMVKSSREVTDKYGKKQYEVVLVQLDGTELETKVVDLEESVEQLNKKGTVFADEDALAAKLYQDVVKHASFVDAKNNATGANGADTFCDNCGETTGNCVVSDIDRKAANIFAGTMIRYTLKGGDIVIREMVTSAGTTTSSYDVKKIVDFTEDYSEKSAKLGSYRLNEDTIIYVAKDLTGSKAAYSVKLEKVNFADLGTSDGLTGFVYNVDKNTKIVEAVLLTEEPSRATDKNYGIVLNVESFADDAEDDYDTQIELLLNDGKVVELLVEDDTDLAAGVMIEAFIEGDKLVDRDIVSETDGTYDELALNVLSFNDSTVKVLVWADAGVAGTVEAGELSVDVKDIAENCIFVEYDADKDEYSKGSQGSIKEIAELANDAAPTVAEFSKEKETLVNAYVVKNTETEQLEVVAMFYTAK